MSRPSAVTAATAPTAASHRSTRHPAKAGPDAAALPTDVPASPLEPSQVQVMNQARQDLAAGLVDTDMHATPGLDAQRRAALVPGPGGQQPAPAGPLTAQASSAGQSASKASAGRPTALRVTPLRGSKPGR